MAEADEAIRRLAGVDINGYPVKVEIVSVSQHKRQSLRR